MSAADTMRCLSRGGGGKELQCQLDKGHSCFHKNDGVTWEDDIYDAVADYRDRNLSEPEPPPVINNSTAIAELVIQDLRDRMKFGLAKYGTLLQANNGRNAGVDAYQEQLDHLIYFRQLIEERFLLLVAIAAEFRAAGFYTPSAADTPEQIFRSILRGIESARRFKSAHEVLVRERYGEVWVWQDGGNNFKTITCPILILPSQLQEIAENIAKHAENPFLVPSPIPMVLHCPNCGTQHIDAPEPQCEYLSTGAGPSKRCVKIKGHSKVGISDTKILVHSTLEKDSRWTNPPHKSHLCSNCKTVWRPAEVFTTGVASVTPGTNDTWKPK